MDYGNVYQKLVDRGILRGKIHPAERHHIMPRSMGGKDRKNNIVYFTPREHLIAHILLWKIYRNKSMSHALWMMCHTRNVRINSRQYEILKLEHSKNTSERNKGRRLPEEHKDKIRQANLGREDDGRYIKTAAKNRGRKHTDEIKQRMSKSSKHSKMSEEHKEKLRQIHTGRIVTEETKENCASIRARNHHFTEHNIQMNQRKISETQQGRKGRSGKDNPFYGKHHAEETKQRMSESAKNKPL